MSIATGPINTAQYVKHRAIAGAKALVVRTAFGLVLRFGSSVCLAHLLFPADYGVFSVVAYLTGLSMFLGDVGLAAALVRQEHEPEENEVFTVFCCQQVFTAFVVVVLLVFARRLVVEFGLSAEASLLLRVMAAGLFLSSLRVVPMLMLERSVAFGTIARCEMIESIALAATTISLAAAKAGPWALVGGGIVRGVVGLACVWWASPWRPRGRFRFMIVRRLMGFGLYFQLNALAPAVFGGWVPFLVGRLIGAAAVGIANWAIALSSIPGSLILALIRVAFPAFSRLQDQPEELSRAVEGAVIRMGTLLFVLAPIGALGAPWGIPFIFGHRWDAAIVLVQWLALTCVLASINGLMASSQNAIGRASDRLWIAIGVGVLTWPVAYIFLKKFGLPGLGPASFIATGLETIASCYALRGRGIVTSLFARRMVALCAGPMAFTALAIATQERKMLRGHTFAQMITGLGVFVALTLMVEAMNPLRPLTTQIRRTWWQVRRKNPEDACAGGPC